MSTHCFCGKFFPTVGDLHQHATQSGHRVRCECAKLFATREEVFKHQSQSHPGGGVYNIHPSLAKYDRGAPVNQTDCNLCGKKNFKDARALDDHKRDRHPSCPVCKACSPDCSRLELHKRGSGHCYCDEHDIIFTTLAEFKVHRNDGKHVTGFECLDCERSFGTQQGLDDHLKTDAHAGAALTAIALANEAQNAAAAAAAQAAAKEETDLRCEECDRQFTNITAFKQHKASLKHNKLSDLKCPLSDRCSKTFTSPSSLLFHLESGKCKSGMNRHKLNAMVHMHDSGRHITHQKNVVGILQATSMASSLPSVSDHASLRSALSSSVRGSAIFTPDGSDAVSETGSTSTIREIPDVASDILSLSGRNGVLLTTSTTAADLTSTMSTLSLSSRRNSVALTPDAGMEDAIEVESIISSTSAGVPINTPSHSRPSSRNGGAPLSTAGEWSLINTYKMAPPMTSTVSDETIKYDGKAKKWVCTINACNRSFQKKKDLLQHRESPVHQIDLYHCPSGLEAFGTAKKTKGFKTLSGFAQHIEAGACAGGKEALKHIAGLFEAEIAKSTGKQVKLLNAGAFKS